MQCKHQSCRVQAQKATIVLHWSSVNKEEGLGLPSSECSATALKQNARSSAKTNTIRWSQHNPSTWILIHILWADDKYCQKRTD